MGGFSLGARESMTRGAEVVEVITMRARVGGNKAGGSSIVFRNT